MKPSLKHSITALFLLATYSLSAADAPLADATERRDTAARNQLLAQGANVNAAQVDGATALHWAVFHDDAEAVTALLRAGAKANTLNRYGVPPLAAACTNGNAVIMNQLLAAGADPNAELKGGETMLMLAARAGHVDAVKALLARGAKVDARERLGQTALMWAAAEGHTAVVVALLEAKTDLHAAAESGHEAFFYAIRAGHQETVRALLAAGADAKTLLRSTKGPRVTPLSLAVLNGHFELAIALVDAGADPNDVRTGFTPLHMIAGVRKPDSSDISDPAPATGAGRLSSAGFVREIVKRGANVNARLPQGSPKQQPNTSSSIGTVGATPFLFAADRGDVPLMRLLLKLGADPLLPNAEGTTPLLAAAGVGTNEPQEEAGEESEAVEAVKLLLDLGASVNTVDQNGDTAMHGAAYNISPLVVKLLAERGADPQIWSKPNQAGGTPLFIAEGYISRLPRPDAPTIAAITQLMVKAGISTGGPRPKIIDSYEKPAAPATPTAPPK
ncbi:MAG: ankyrin repeat domain-containing protein [Bryobacteraceae bacterium]|nr:ankyrin repeat domain-containing protein [Bryobacteraceae bacterium]